MKIKWLGHSCFLITSEQGVRIITDPYKMGGDIKYTPTDRTADIVTVSHDHSDHNEVSWVTVNPEIFKGKSPKSIKGIQFRGVATFHDKAGGGQRGSNMVICFSVDGIRLCHLGDLGHRLDSIQIKEIGEIDVLLIPVGGHFTIDADTAAQICEDLRPRVIIPMHFKTPKLNFPISGVDDFLAGKEHVNKSDASEVEFKAGHLPEFTQIMVLRPSA